MNKPQRKMGLIMLTALVSGNMLGSGVFLLPASLASLGTISILSWILTSVGAMFLALLFARISQLVTMPGSPYVYSRLAFGRFIGFQIAYTYWITVWIGNAALAIATVGYLRVFVPELTNPIYSALLAIGLIWFFTLINLRGARLAGWIQVITLVCKMVPLLFIIVIGWWYFNPDNLSAYYNVTSESDWSVFTKGASLTLWAFIGVESATVGADRAKNPKVNIPLATLFGTFIAAIIYILSVLIIMAIIPLPELAKSSSPFALAAKYMLGNWGEDMVAAGAVISCMGALNGWVLLQGQVPMNAAKDHYFPKFLARRNRFEIPYLALIITSVLISALILMTIHPNLVKQFSFIITLAVLTALIPYFYTAMAYIPISKRFLKVKRAIVIAVTVALFAGAYSYFAIFSSGERIAFYGLLFLLTSFPLYAFMHREKEGPTV